MTKRPAPADGGGVLAALPLKPFAAAKGRLNALLDASARASLTRAVAARVAAVCRAAGAVTAVVTSDPEVADWAEELGLEVIAEPPGGGLDGAAAAVVAEAGRRDLAWCVVHADLPLLAAADVAAVTQPAGPGRVILAPSRDGGTNLLAGAGPFRFAYGPGSFARHLAVARDRDRLIVVRVGTALDLDTPEDLRLAAAGIGGHWLRSYLT